MQDEILNKISETLLVARAKLTLETPLSDLVADSLDAFELLTVLDSDYQVRIDPAQINELHTVGDLVAFIEANKGSVAPGESLKTI